jgi:hypothetical protein
MNSDAQRVLDMVLAMREKKRAFQDREYTDEPILMRGSQMAAYTPPRIAEMRKLEHAPEARTKPGAWLFFQQAKFMEDYEDDAPIRGVYSQYFPTYANMNDRQLRGYFTWRTAVRHGRECAQPASLSFVFVHLYELLMGIGIELEPLGRPAGGLSASERGFIAIEYFCENQKETFPELARYQARWLRDYAVWHNLPKSYLAPYVDTAFDLALIDLQEGLATWGEHVPARPRGKKAPFAAAGAPNPSEERLFSALDALSTYRPRVSRLYRERPDTLRHVSCAVVAELSRYFEKQRKAGLVETYFGSPIAMPYTMFMNAVFWAGEPHEDMVYEISPCSRYGCANGRWYHEGFQGARDKSAKLGHVLRVVDQRLREAIAYPHPLAAKDAPKYLDKIIAEKIADRLAWEKERERRAVRVDLSQLAGIRAAASATRESLLIDEEREEDAAPGEMAVTVVATAEKPTSSALETSSFTSILFDLEESTAEAGLTSGIQAPEEAPAPVAAVPGAVEAPAATAPEPAAGTAPFGLTADELGLLQTLLEGARPTAAASLDMLVDGINEKLYDLLGDTALEFDLMSGMPVIIEDYEQDVREAICHE